MTTAALRWGILATGAIAHAFAKALAGDPAQHRLAAVGSRTRAGAERFAAAFPGTRAHASHESLCADPEVEAVYIASTNQAHVHHALLAIAAGKHVLVEKPFALDAHEGARIVAAARAKGVFCMEAMWTRFLPAWQQAMNWIASGDIGVPRLLVADFGCRCDGDPASRFLAPGLGGGTLLDMGVYGVSLASWIFGGAPASIAAAARIGATGVDESTAVSLGYGQGAAAIACTLGSWTPHQAVICGSAGRIEVPDFWRARRATLRREWREPEEASVAPSDGYLHEAEEVRRCIRSGMRESPRMPLDESLAVLATLDECRRQIGLACPPQPTASTHAGGLIALQEGRS